MMINYDHDRYKTVSSFTTCSFHKQNPGESYAGCTCSGSIGQVRVTDEEYRQRRADRERREDDVVLAKADAIRAKRAASGIETEGHDPQGHGAEHESPTAESGDAQ